MIFERREILDPVATVQIGYRTLFCNHIPDLRMMNMAAYHVVITVFNGDFRSHLLKTVDPIPDTLLMQKHRDGTAAVQNTPIMKCYLCRKPKSGIGDI